MRFRPFFLSAALLFVAACGSDSSSPTAPPPSQTLTHGTMSAVVDGQAWTASVGLQAAYQNNILAFAGVAAGNSTIAIALAPLGGPGTYTISVGEATNASYSIPGGAPSQWQALGGVGGTGSVVLTTLTATGASGTFSFELPPITNTSATGTKSITNGKFDLTF
jgi:hypothetical protein